MKIRLHKEIPTQTHPTAGVELRQSSIQVLTLNFSEQTNTHHAAPQFMKVRRQKKKKKVALI